MEKSMADQFLEQQAAREQQQAEAEKAAAEKEKDRDFQPEHHLPPAQEKESTHKVDLDGQDGNAIRAADAKIDERQTAAMQEHLESQMPELDSKDVENHVNSLREQEQEQEMER